MIEADRDEVNALDVPAVDGLRQGSLQGIGERPETIGPYKILGVLGSGGMGVVYEAEQGNPARRVALKVVRPGFMSESLLRRFEHEARVLGWLNHPGIAQIYEAGTHNTGGGAQPFFAMELVRGAPILRYADDAELDHAARLDLLAKVCDAVQHAHQKGVIHRDLKPSNVLVDDQGQPKVLDFGVARVAADDLGGESWATTLHTRTGELVGTLTYMSPEQVSGQPGAVDTRSDVYALGVLAHELLVGRPPIDVRGKMVHEAARAIIEDEPSTLGELNITLRGDVETIVTKSLAKEKERRYASAEELASDIRRFLHDQPIVARPSSAVYHFSKFARRNRALVAGSAIAVLALAIGAATTTWMYVNTERARVAAVEAKSNEAEQKEIAQAALKRTVDAERSAREAARKAEFEAGVATEVKDFLVQLLNKSNPLNSYGEEITLETLLERGTRGVLDGEHTPEVRAELLSTIALSYQGMGRTIDSVELMEAAMEAGRGITAASFQPMRLRIMRRLGRAYVDIERLEDSHALLLEAEAFAEQLFGPEHASTLRVRSNIGLTLMRMGRMDAARPIMAGVSETIERRDLELAEGDEGQEVHDFIRAHRYYNAHLLSEAGEIDAAVAEIRKVIGFYDRRGRPNDPHLIGGLTALSRFLKNIGRGREAREPLLRALDIAENHLAPGAVQACTPLIGLAQLDLGSNKLEAAEVNLRRAIELYERNRWDGHRDMAQALSLLSDLHVRRDEPELGLDHLLRAADILSQIDPESPEVDRCIERFRQLLLRADGRDPELAVQLGRRTFEWLAAGGLDSIAAKLAGHLYEAGRPLE